MSPAFRAGDRSSARCRGATRRRPSATAAAESRRRTPPGSSAGAENARARCVETRCDRPNGEESGCSRRDQAAPHCRACGRTPTRANRPFAFSPAGAAGRRCCRRAWPPSGSGQDGALKGKTEPRQTASRARPLARRARRTLRPPTVFIRARKPCVRLRLTTEGW